MRKTPALVSAIVMAGLSAIAAPAFACENDAQCKGDRVCSNGECVEPPSRGAQGAAPATTPPGPSPAATQGPPPAATMAPPPPAGAPGAYPPPGAYYPAPGGYPPGAYPPGAYALPPGSAPPAEPRMRRRVGLLVTGSVLGGVGVIGLIIGGLTYAAGSASSSLCDASSYYYSSYDSCADSGTRAAGAVVMIGSGLLVATAIPLIIVGARKVPVDKDESSSRGLTVAIQPRPAGLGLVGTF
jgi:hypothetical protein